MPKNLLIVESPAKAKTIEKYLGKDFTVKSSYGHVRDLDKGQKGVDVESDFKPKYVVTPAKRKVVKELKEWVKKVDTVWLATDEDREGEAISWHLCEVLGLDEETTKRIVFREITKPAILKAIEQPRIVDKNLVNAQQARRILDRLVGFELSEILWRKVKGKLSAGRVQSVAVKLIVEREREIQSFESLPFFKITAHFEGKDDLGRTIRFKAELPKRYNTEEEAAQFLEKAKGAEYQVKEIEVKPFQRKPSAPFTTSTLQQEASRKLGFAVRRTMSAAQKLYEAGHISYMRTDSTSLSQTAIDNIAEAIQQSFGEKYLNSRQYKSKKANTQEAHEAIRPTYNERREVSSDSDLQRLYDLIWKRTIASQMANAQFERTSVKIGISTIPNEMLAATGEVLKFDGFLKVYHESADEDAEDENGKHALPPLHKGQRLDLEQMQAMQRFTRPPSRYTEASLVKKLEELGIGRPSTYAPTITKIMEPARGYVVKDSREGEDREYAVLSLKHDQISKETRTEKTGATSKRLYPSDIGMLVTDFLDEHFQEIMDYGFTANIEGRFDSIAEGDLIWNDMLSQFYNPFHEKVEDTKENASRARGRRDLGIDPETGHTILVQITRFGPVVQIGTREEVGEEGKPKFANLRNGQSMENITLEEAKELFKLPKKLGEYKGKEVILGAGRYGPYVKYDELFVSIPRSEDPMELTMERAQELIDAKLEETKPIGEYQGKPITKGKGRFGPYFKWNGLFVNIPKRFDPATITFEESIELIKAKAEKEANRYIKIFEKEKINVENGRWGPFIRKGRKSISIPKIDGDRITSEQAKELTLEEVQQIIDGEMPESVIKRVKESVEE